MIDSQLRIFSLCMEAYVSSSYDPLCGLQIPIPHYGPGLGGWGGLLWLVCNHIEANLAGVLSPYLRFLVFFQNTITMATM